MAWPNNVTKADLVITCSRGSGKGGQKRNKTSTKVRIVHVPTGHWTECDETRSQHENKRIAFRKLADQLVPIMKKEIRRERFRAPVETVRTYHEPDNRVGDVRIAGKLWQYEDVVSGKALDEIHEAIILSGRGEE